MHQFNQIAPSEELLTLSPEATIREFVKYFREIKPRYEEAVRLMKLSEDQENDILHYIELHTDLPAAKGYKIYRKLADVLRARRAYKAETELLEPMYQFVTSHAGLSDQLSQVQGRTRGTREAIERRQYICRTDILDDMPE